MSNVERFAPVWLSCLYFLLIREKYSTPAPRHKLVFSCQVDTSSIGRRAALDDTMAHASRVEAFHMFSRTSLVASTSSSRPRAASSRVRGRRLALDVSAVAKAKNADAGRSVHWRKGPERFNAGGTASKDAPRGGKGSGKTTRSQRTNKVYKRYLAGRPSVDDVERASLGDRTKAMGVVEREAPYRLNRADREAWERAKRRGGHGFGNGTGGGGVLEIKSKQTSALAPHRHPLINTHRLYCDAKFALFVVVEQDPSGEDEVVVDLSTLRLERDAPVRARLLQVAADFGDAILATDDLCADIGEPIDDRVRYLRAIARLAPPPPPPPPPPRLPPPPPTVRPSRSRRPRRRRSPRARAAVDAAASAVRVEGRGGHERRPGGSRGGVRVTRGEGRGGAARSRGGGGDARSGGGGDGGGGGGGGEDGGGSETNPRGVSHSRPAGKVPQVHVRGQANRESAGESNRDGGRRAPREVRRVEARIIDGGMRYSRDARRRLRDATDHYELGCVADISGRDRLLLARMCHDIFTPRRGCYRPFYPTHRPRRARARASHF